MTYLDNAGALAELPAPVGFVNRDGESGEIVSEIANRYKAKQMDSFKSVNSVPGDWRMCDISGMMLSGRDIQFDIPAGYSVVKPFTASLSDIERIELQKALDVLRQNGVATGVCELCGHWIVYPYPIQDDKLKLVMMVGSTCVETFSGAGYILKQVKIFRETKLRSLFQVWISDAIAFLERQRDISKFTPDGQSANGKSIAKCDECGARVLDDEYSKIVHSKRHGWTGRLSYATRTEISKLNRMDGAKMSSRKILNAFARLQEAYSNLAIPAEVSEILTIEAAKRETRKAAKSQKGAEDISVGLPGFVVKAINLL